MISTLRTAVDVFLVFAVILNIYLARKLHIGWMICNNIRDQAINARNSFIAMRNGDQKESVRLEEEKDLLTQEETRLGKRKPFIWL